MKAPVALGVGLASGAFIAAALLPVWPRREQSRRNDAAATDAEIAALRHEVAQAQAAAQRDRAALRSAEQQIKTLRESANTTASPASAIATASTAASGSSAMATYLGSPVPTPANLDQRYSAEELSAVFRDLAETLGIKLDRLGVDTTEFPFIIHGSIDSTAGGGFFKKIDAELRALPGYTYGGSVTGSTRGGTTYFALNMTPSSAYPKEHAEAIRRRLMLRLQMMAAAWADPPP